MEVKLSEENKVVYYKGFDSEFKCLGFQFEVGATYKHDGDVKACNSGFHSCSNPWDVLSYYDITSRFAYVEVSGKTDTHSADSKIASAEINIKAEIKLPEFIADCINYLKDICKSEVDITHDIRLAASGDSSSLAASGNSSRLAASGEHSILAASGDSSSLAASGYYSSLAASGNSSRLAASGYSSRLAASGDYSIACCSGINSKSKIGILGAMSLSRWVESEKRYRISVAYEGENGIKADTWYQLDGDGEFVECD
jgi:hypothetical protein